MRSAGVSTSWPFQALVVSNEGAAGCDTLRQKMVYILRMGQRNPAPIDRWFIPVFIGFLVVQDFAGPSTVALESFGQLKDDHAWWNISRWISSPSLSVVFQGAFWFLLSGSKGIPGMGNIIWGQNRWAYQPRWAPQPGFSAIKVASKMNARSSPLGYPWLHILML